MTETAYLLQTVIIESANYENIASFPSKKLIMDNLLQVLRKDESTDVCYKLEIFQEGLEMAKVILRDSLNHAKQMNKVKDITKLEEKRQAIPRITDSYHHYCFYFISVFALSHIALNISSSSGSSSVSSSFPSSSGAISAPSSASSSSASSSNICLLPGCIETFLFCMLTKPSPSSAALLADHQRPGSRRNKGKQAPPVVSVADVVVDPLASKDSSKPPTPQGYKSKEKSSAPPSCDFPLSWFTCYEYCQKLAIFVGHAVLNERVLEELRISKSRLGKLFTHPGKKRQYDPLSYSVFFWFSSLCIIDFRDQLYEVSC
jgi:hypothetical protein